VLVPLAPLLRTELAPGGRLVASGIFVHREAEVLTAFEASGLTVTERTGEGDWVALEATTA
jgi:ribosomal protein L11 methylase PrmA